MAGTYPVWHTDDIVWQEKGGPLSLNTQLHKNTFVKKSAQQDSNWLGTFCLLVSAHNQVGGGGRGGMA